jgi:Protein of unknown function (DUF2637)
VSDGRDRYRVLTTAAVLLVAAIAAVISFVHIEALAVRYGQPLMAAVLLPVSIDGTVAVASVTMLRAARLGLSAPWLARTMLLLSVGATLACNVAFGLPHGWPGALLSGWPAVAFVGSAEVAISMSRKRAPATTHRNLVNDKVSERDRTRTRRAPARRTPAAPVTDTDAASEFMDELASGAVPSIRQIRARLHLGQERARGVQAHLRELARTP